MKKELAYKIIQAQQLILGKDSRSVLNKIIKGEKIEPEHLPDGVNYDQITHLTEQYNAKCLELKYDKTTPRYLPFYHIIKDNLPSFMWNYTSQVEHNRDTEIHAPRVKNLRPSLLSLLLNKVEKNKNTFLHQNYECIDRLPNSVITTLDSFMQQSNIYYPPEKEMEDIVTLLSNGLMGNQVTVFIPVCPDYTFEYTGDTKCPVRFTFSDLGCGNGIVAQWLLSVIKDLAETLDKCNIKAKFIIAMCDFEAFSADNLKTFAITEEEFIRRTYLSKQAFKKSCPIDAEVIMFTELCTKHMWLKHMESVRHMFIAKNYGFSDLDKDVLLSIVEKRKALYARWYGEREILEDYIDIALAHGTMYSAMGIVLNEHYKNCLVFAADSKVMRYFYSVSKKIPTLYVNKEYS